MLFIAHNQTGGVAKQDKDWMSDLGISLLGLVRRRQQNSKADIKKNNLHTQPIKDNLPPTPAMTFIAYCKSLGLNVIESHYKGRSNMFCIVIQKN